MREGGRGREGEGRDRGKGGIEKMADLVLSISHCVSVCLLHCGC